MSDPFAAVRAEVCATARRMWEAGLVVASAGNVSARAGEGLIAITPTSVPYEGMRAEQIVVVGIDGGLPSYELPMHRVIYQRRADVAAIVHTHAPFITTLSILRRPLPPVIDEMVVHFGGTVEVADYAFTGTEELGENAVRALGDRSGVILANHGNVCVARTLERALQLAVAMEACARAYVQALQLGEPVELPESAIAAGRRLFEERRT